MRRVPWVLSLVGCGGTLNSGDVWADPEIPSWIESEITGQTDACSSSPYWEDANMSTSFWAGTYTFDGDQVIGHEYWIHYPNANLTRNTGFQPCQVVWTVSGMRREPANAANTYGLVIAATIDEEATDCVEDASGTPLYVGDEQFTVEYDVFENGGAVRLTFAESGNLVGEGEATNRSLSWLSEYSCNIY